MGEKHAIRDVFCPPPNEGTETWFLSHLCTCWAISGVFRCRKARELWSPDLPSGRRSLAVLNPDKYFMPQQFRTQAPLSVPTDPLRYHVTPKTWKIQSVDTQ